MGSNRLTRDEILIRALDLIDSPSLDQKARPLAGGIDQSSFLFGWLQDGLDFFHRKFPWAGLLQTAAYTISGTDTYTLPTDFVLDKRNGLRLFDGTTKRRCLRKSLDWLLSADTSTLTTGRPVAYVILTPTFRVYPTPNKAYTAELWYYSLPPALVADTIPAFPDDWTLVEFVRLRGKEWTGELPAGSALGFAGVLCADLQKSGLGTEADDDALPLDAGAFHPTGSEGPFRTGWMGDPTVH